MIILETNMARDTIDALSPRKVHIIGIGGSGIFYLAKFLKLLGWKVQGSDFKASNHTTQLIDLGIHVFQGHKPSNLKTYPDLIIVSPAVPTTVPELQEATKLKIPVIPYHLALEQIFAQLRKDIVRKQVEKTLKDSDFAPFYFLDTSNTKIIGITGTDGKTTTCSMIHHILLKQGINAGIITTVFAKLNNKEVDTGLHTTTPPAQELAPIVKQMIEDQAEVLVMEITSHGLAQFRVEGLPIDIAAFTNISPEHLDFHETWKQLVADKGKLISMVKKEGSTILNADDQSFKPLSEIATKENVDIKAYGIKNADLLISNVTENNAGISSEISLKNDTQTFQLSLPIFGKYNVANAAAAISVCNELDITLAESIAALKDFQTVKGRMEIIQKEPFYAIVDFAHTPNALKNALVSAKKLKFEKGRIFIVFGCAGLRDTYKRAKMGKIAQELADIVVLTAEDPRTETLSNINDQIIKGMSENRKVFQEGDVNEKEISELLASNITPVAKFDKMNPTSREDAIKWALTNAKPGDVVIATGKGHEQSLCFGDKEYPWSDIEKFKQLLNKENK